MSGCVQSIRYKGLPAAQRYVVLAGKGSGFEVAVVELVIFNGVLIGLARVI